MKDLAYPSRRVRIFTLPVHFMVALLTGKDGEVRILKLLNDGIPDDAEVVGVNYDFCRDMIYIKVAHDSFCQIPEGADCEQISVYFERGPEDNFVELF